MRNDAPGLLGRFAFPNSLDRVQKRLTNPARLSHAELEKTIGQMQALREKVDEVASQARSELATRGSSTDEWVPTPDQCDWLGRPATWTTQLRPRGVVDAPSPTPLGENVQLFHDASQADLSLRQESAPLALSGAPFSLVLELYRFDGSFLSLVWDLPQSALDHLTLNHVYSVHLRMACEQPVEIYARLNVQHGPNTEQIVRQLDVDGDHGIAEFDLAYSKINEKRVEKAWLDLIMEGPDMNRIALWDMVVLRAPRADI